MHRVKNRQNIISKEAEIEGIVNEQTIKVVILVVNEKEKDWVIKWKVKELDGSIKTRDIDVGKVGCEWLWTYGKRDTAGNIYSSER